MFDRNIFFERIERRPHKAKLRADQRGNYNRILDYWEGLVADGKFDPDPRHLANPLATVFLETGVLKKVGNKKVIDRTIAPVKEYGPESYLKSKPYYPWIGEGLVQVTWEKNHRKFGATKPGQMLTWPKALDAMFRGMRDGMFTGKKLSTYFNATKDDPINARRIINGTDRADDVAGYHRDYLEAIKAAGYTGKRPARRVEPEPDEAANDDIPDKPEPTGDEGSVTTIERTEDTRPHGETSGQIELVQKRLKERGYMIVGDVEGRWGGSTAGAIEAFKNDRKLPGEAVIDAALMAELDEAEAEGFTRPISKERAEATPEQVVEKTEKPGEAIQSAGWSESIGKWLLAVPAGLGMAWQWVVKQFETVRETLGPVVDMLDGIPKDYYFIALGVVAYLVIRQSRQTKAAVTEGYQKGEVN